LIVQIININSPFVFKKYNKKYNIFKDLRDRGYFGIEIRNTSEEIAAELHQHILRNETFSYLKKNDSGIDLFILGTFEQILELTSSVKSYIAEEVGHKIAEVINNFLSYKNVGMDFIKNSSEQNFIMGILNSTPDSFSDGGKYFDLDIALRHIDNMVSDGADIIDIGGESTRPNAKPINVKEELSRVIPIIDNFQTNNSLVLSIDTYKSEVADEALKRGVKIVNDISGLTKDEKMMDIVKRHNACCVVMHMKGTPETMQSNPNYNDVVSEVYEFLYNRILSLKKVGISKIVIDPGIGFGKTLSHNYEIINRLDEFKGLGCPILIGLSRKSLIGKALNLDVSERDLPTSILESFSLMKGAKIVRTHNVKNANYVRKLFSLTNNPFSTL